MNSNHRILGEILDFYGLLYLPELKEKINNSKEELNTGFNLFSEKLLLMKYEGNYEIFCNITDEIMEVKIQMDTSLPDEFLRLMDELVNEWYIKHENLSSFFKFQIEC